MKDAVPEEVEVSSTVPEQSTIPGPIQETVSISIQTDSADLNATSDFFSNLISHEESSILIGTADEVQEYAQEISETKTDRKFLERLSNNDSFLELSTKEQLQLLQIYHGGGPAVTKELLFLLKHSDPEKRTGLYDRDEEGRSLLENLSYLSDLDVDNDFERQFDGDYADIVASIVEEATFPGRINQDARNTCTVASMQYILCSENPSEYVRLMTGLLEEGSVEMAGGDSLVVSKGSLSRDDTYKKGNGRSDSERIFQSALMEYALGDSLDYRNKTDDRELHSGDPLRTLIETGGDIRRAAGLLKDLRQDPLSPFKRFSPGGLSPLEERRCINALFGADFKDVIVDEPKSEVEQVHRSIVQSGGDPIQLFNLARKYVQQTERRADKAKSHVHALAQALSRGADPITMAKEEVGHLLPGDRVVSIIENKAEEDLLLTNMVWPPGGHAVVVTGIHDGRVYFKNPHGADDPKGKVYTMPPRRMEDPEQDIESMKVEDFRLFAVDIFVKKRS